MKILKGLLLSLAIFMFASTGYLYYIYDSYEQKQQDVREFQNLAFQGYSAVNARDYVRALDSYKKAVAIYDKDSKSLADLASLYRQKGDMKNAKKFYEKAYTAKKDNPKNLYNLALCNNILGEYDESIENLMELMHVDKRSTKYYRLLSLNYYKLKKYEKALGYYAVLVQRNSYADDNASKDVRALYEESSPKPKPTHILHKYTKTDDKKELFSLIEVYKKEGYDIKALKAANKILMQEPENDKANKIAAELLYMHKSYNEAYNYVSRVKEYDARSYEILGAIHQKAKNYKMALEAYESSYKLQPKKEVLRAIVVSAAGVGNSEKAATYLKELEEIDPLLATKLMYALELKSGAKNGTYEKLLYLAKVEVLKLYCKVDGCKI